MDENIWVQLTPLQSVSDEERDRVIAASGAKLAFELPQSGRPSVVLGDSLTEQHAVPEHVTVYDSKSFREVFGLDLDGDARIAAVRAWGSSTSPWNYRWPGILNLLSGCASEAERYALARLANDVCSDIAPEDRCLAGGAIDLAMKGTPALTIAGESTAFTRPEDLSRAQWLGEDPTRVPNLRHIGLFGDDPELALDIVRALGTRPFFLKVASALKLDYDAFFEALPSSALSLDFNYSEGGTALFEAIAASKAWPTLERLSLHNNNGKSRGIKALVAAPKTGPLVELDVGHNHLKPADFTALAKAPWLDTVQRLRVKYNDARAKGAKALLSSKRLSRLESLDFGANEIGDEGVASLCANKVITRLRKLSLEGNSVDPLVKTEGARALADWGAASSLEELNLGQNEIGDEGFVALLTSQNLGSLRVLDVQYNGVTTKAFEELGSISGVTRPRVVNLSGNKLGTAGYGAKPKAPKKRTAKSPPSVWANAVWLSECLDLNLYNTELDPDAMADMLDCPHLEKLRSLNLSSNYGLGSQALEYLCAHKRSAQLESLEIMYWKLSPGDGAVIAKAPFAQRIQRISVSKEGLDPQDVSLLRDTFGARIYLS
jgi:Ran GTPase-activating protein (RanGAP) involved in mRNA processing and transport